MPEIQTDPFTFDSNVKLTGEKVQLIEFGKSRIDAYNKLLKKHRLTHNIKWN